MIWQRRTTAVRRQTVLMVLLGIGVIGVTGPAASGQEAEVPDLQQIVESSADRFVDAFGGRDAAAIAQLFTPEAEYVHASGVIFHGRPAIESEFAAAFAANPPGTMKIELISIRPIADGVVIEDGISTFMPAENGPTTQTRYTATHVRQPDGTWLIASIRELDTAHMTPHDRLQALSWLVGGWQEDVDGNVIVTEWKWSDSGNFLIGEFSVRQSADVHWTGTHRIGWDAERTRFRSWVFEARGGFLEGWWRPNDDGSWSVQLSGVDAEGVRRSSILTYAPDGEDAIVVTQGQRMVDGESLPESVHRVVRRPPAAGITTSQR